MLRLLNWGPYFNALSESHPSQLLHSIYHFISTPQLSLNGHFFWKTGFECSGAAQSDGLAILSALSRSAAISSSLHSLLLLAGQLLMRRPAHKAMLLDRGHMLYSPCFTISPAISLPKLLLPGPSFLGDPSLHRFFDGPWQIPLLAAKPLDGLEPQLLLHLVWDFHANATHLESPKQTNPHYAAVNCRSRNSPTHWPS